MEMLWNFWETQQIDEEYLKSIKPNPQTDELDLQKLFSDFEDR